MKSSSTKYLALFVLLAFLWGGSFVAIKESLKVFDSWFAAASRLVIALSVLFVIFSFQKKNLRIEWRLAWKIWLTGLFTMGIPFSLLFWGEQFISAGLAGMMNGTTPLWTAALASLMVAHEREALRRPGMRAGLLLGFVGILLLFAPLVSLEDLSQIHGAFAVLMMAVCYAIANVLNRIFFAGNPKLSLSASCFHQNLSSTAYLLLGLFLFGARPETLDFGVQWKAWLSLLYLGCFSTAFALMIYFFLLKEWGAVKTSAVTYLVPVFAVSLDFLFYQTRPGVLSLFGILFVLGGVFFIRSSTVTSPNQIKSDADKRNTQELAHAQK